MRSTGDGAWIERVRISDQFVFDCINNRAIINNNNFRFGIRPEGCLHDSLETGLLHTILGLLDSKINDMFIIAWGKKLSIFYLDSSSRSLLIAGEISTGIAGALFRRLSGSFIAGAYAMAAPPR